MNLFLQARASKNVMHKFHVSESLADFAKVEMPVLHPHLLDLGVVGPRNPCFPQISQMLLINTKV